MSKNVRIDYDEKGHDSASGLAALFIIQGMSVWIPLSQIKDIDEEDNWVEIPEWLAKEEGLI